MGCLFYSILGLACTFNYEPKYYPVVNLRNRTDLRVINGVAYISLIIKKGKRLVLIYHQPIRERNLGLNNIFTTLIKAIEFVALVAPMFSVF